MSPRARATVTSIRAAKQPVEPAPVNHRIGSSGSETLCLEIPIRAIGSRAITALGGELVKGDAFEEDTNTMLLFARGAVIRLSAPVACGHDLMLINKRSNKYVHCWITNVRTCPDVKSYVDIEFTHSAPDFWGISFPKEEAKAAAAAAAAAASSPATYAVQEPEQTAEVPHIEACAEVQVEPLAAEVVTPPAGVVREPPPLRAEKVVTLPWRIPQVVPEAPHALDTVPFLVPEPAHPLATPDTMHAQVESAQAMKWEALSVAQPRGRGLWLAVAASVLVCSATVGYFLSPPAEPGLAPAPEIANVAAVQGPLAEATESAVAAVHNLKSADAAGEERTQAGELSAKAATAGENQTAPLMPEVSAAESPRRLVVLVSKMNAPAPFVSIQTQSAPELPVSGAASASLGAEQPGQAAGLLGAAAAQPTPPAAPAEAVETPKEPAESLTPARLLFSVPPSYPVLARQARIQGDVVIEAQIDATGKVTGANVISGPQMLRDAAVRALSAWKFEPARLRGQATASTTVVTLHFHL